jgi:hypothetical protein
MWEKILREILTEQGLWSVCFLSQLSFLFTIRGKSIESLRANKTDRDLQVPIDLFSENNLCAERTSQSYVTEVVAEESLTRLHSVSFDRKAI